MNSIRIRVHKAGENADPGASKFFGDPTIPSAWEDKFAEHIVFIAQIRLADIAHLDTENRLPHKGYLYFFLDSEMYPYYPMMEYYEGEPDMLLEEFNALDHEFSHLTESWEMEFFPGDEDPSGIRLFGEPAMDIGETGALLLQYDPLVGDLGFMDNIDGYVYFLFGEDEKDLSQVQLLIDYL